MKMNNSKIKQCFILIFIVFSLCCCRVYAQDSVCAEVKLEIKQELSLERQAFDAHMRILNSLPETSLDNVAVKVLFTDELGNLVTASFDSSDTEAAFFIRVDTLENITDVDGSGSVSPASYADIHWLIIPAPGSGGQSVSGKLYYVGAELTYTLNGEEQLTRVSPDYIHVKPMPELTLDYFLPEYVYGDDAFTTQIEAPVPFVFGARVKNSGYGKAVDLSIQSAQPEITENEENLLVHFVITGTRIQGQETSASLLAQFGDIDPGTCKTVAWTMTSSLSGRFENFGADFTHSDELGGDLTSLITAVQTHTLVGEVRVDLPGRDDISDFLGQSDQGMVIYESENTESQVSDVSSQAGLTVKTGTADEKTYGLTLPQAAGFCFAKLPDPEGGAMEIKRLTRSDGKQISLQNVWFSKEREGTSQWSYYFNIFDVNSTGSYTLVLTEPADSPQAPVVQPVPDMARVEGDQVSFMVIASDPDGTIPSLTAASLPAGAVFTDQENGCAIFDWVPQSGQAGSYSIMFTASDGIFKTSTSGAITICPGSDADCDGMADQWETGHFGSLERDGSEDFDHDGICDLDEYLNGLDPLDGEYGPSAPGIIQPLDGSPVDTLSPVLEIANSTDKDGDALFYDVEIYRDPEYTDLLESRHQVPESTPSTVFSPVEAFLENQTVYWRVRAYDGIAYSLWTYGTFFVNAVDEPPVPPLIAGPCDQGLSATLTPVLSVTCKKNPDQDQLTAGFEIFADEALTLPVAVSPDLDHGEEPFLSWQADTDLEDGATYYWRCKITDDEGNSAFSPVASFTVDVSHSPPGTPLIVSPAQGEEIQSLSPVLTASGTVDPVSGSMDYTFELDVSPAFDSATLMALEKTGITQKSVSWEPGMLTDNTLYFWRVRAFDGSGCSEWAVGSFFTNPVNQAPGTPSISNPGPGAWVTTLAPVLQVNPVSEPDKDDVTFEFEIYADAELSQIVRETETDSFFWRVEPELENFSTYYFRCRAVDGHGLPGSWSPATRFFVKYVDENIAPEITLVQPVTSVVENSGDILIQWTDEDPDSNAVISIFYDTDDQGFDGTLIRDGILEDPDLEDDEFAWNVALVPEGTYYIYLEISDSDGSMGVYSPVPVTVTHNHDPDIPCLPDPENGEIQTLPDLVLSWTGTDPDPADSLSFDLYAGTDPDEMVLSGQGLWVPEFALAGLDYGVQYFWKIVSIDSYGKETQGPLWTFTTMTQTGDADRDGLLNADEIALGTDPFDWDSDNDGYGDGEETGFGTDPKNAGIHPGNGMAADLDFDLDVDGEDLALFAPALGSVSGQPGYLARADFNRDNAIDQKDLCVMASGLGRVNLQEIAPRIDLDKDFDVDGKDLALLLPALGSAAPDAAFFPEGDFNGDGRIDAADLARLVSGFGIVINGE